MNITKTKLDNVTEIKTVEATSHYGTGLLTAIVTSFIELFGCYNEMYVNKIEKAKEDAKQRLINKAKELNADGIMDYSIELSGKTVIVYGTAFKYKHSASYDELPEL